MWFIVYGGDMRLDGARTELEAIQVPVDFGVTVEEHHAVPGRLSLLELLLPQGIASRSLVIGSNCPSLLLPESHMEDGERADLVILAPTVAECRTRGWLEEAMQLLAQRLETEGIAYVLAPPWWRLRLRHALHGYDLSIDLSIIHLPDQASNRYLVPLISIPVRYAFSELIPICPWRRCLALIAFRCPGAARLFGGLLPSVGLVARRAGALPLFSWLLQLAREGQLPSSVIISTSWRGQDGAVVLHRFSGWDTKPTAVAKMNLTTARAHSRVREAAILACLGPRARWAGAQVPQPLLLEQVHERPVLLQTAMGGQLAASLLASRPGRLFDLMERVASWLENWHRSTVVIEPLDGELLNRELLAPATLLAPFLEQGEEYRHWLTRRCATVVGAPVPFVATHNDLTMWNVLLDEHGRLSIVDWEAGREEAFPLVDFFYAMVDAVAATRGYADRLQAFAACFASSGTYTHAVMRLQRRLIQAVVIPAGIVDLCLHACWLHHAVNEYHASEPTDSQPFLHIVQWLVWHRFHTVVTLNKTL